MSGIDVSILLSVRVVITMVSVSYNSGDISMDIFTTCHQLGGVGDVVLLGGPDSISRGGNCWQRTGCCSSSRYCSGTP